MEGVRNIPAEFAGITERWSPRVIAAANGQYVKLAKVQGEFVWHAHADEDEIFIVHRGRLTLRFRDRADVTLGEGDLYVVPRGVEHCPVALEEAWVMLLEPAETKHTGDVESPLTKSIGEQLAGVACTADCEDDAGLPHLAGRCHPESNTARRATTGDERRSRTQLPSRIASRSLRGFP